MEKSKNSYAKEAQKKSLLKSLDDKKEDIKTTAIETGKDLLVGALGGGLLGAMMGRASLVVGAIVAGIGHYAKSRITSVLGVGMMASGTYKSGTVNGTDEKQDVLEGVKDRALAFKDNITHKLWLDKILKSKKKEEPQEEETVSGTDNVRYLVYSGEGEKLLEGADQEPLDMSGLEEIERRVAESGEEFSQKQMGILPSDDSMGDLDPADRNF